MNYTVTPGGIVFEIEPIPDAEAVKAVERIAEQQRDGLERATRPSDTTSTMDSRTEAQHEQPAAA